MPGFKYFLNSQIMTAENFMDFLMKQTVIVCEEEADRDLQLAAYLREGMAAYSQDVDQLAVYDGTDWVRMATFAEASTTYDPRNNDVLAYMTAMIP